jgi:hypothetical protein
MMSDDGFTELEDDEPGELDETLEQQVASYRVALQRSNEYAAAIEREFEAATGRKPRIAELVEAQRDGTVDAWRKGGLADFAERILGEPLLESARLIADAVERGEDVSIKDSGRLRGAKIEQIFVDEVAAGEVQSGHGWTMRERDAWRKWADSKHEFDGSIKAPHGWIQWKGTEVCMDIQCKCGASGHIDADFAYFVRCVKCGAVYKVDGHVRLRDSAESERTKSCAPIDFGEDDEPSPELGPAELKWIAADEAAPFTEESYRALSDAMTRMPVDETVTTFPNGSTSTTIRTRDDRDVRQFNGGDYVRVAAIPVSDPIPDAFDAWPATKQLLDAYHRAVDGMLVELGGLGGPVASRGYVEGKPYETLLLDKDGLVLGRVWVDTSEEFKLTVRAERVDPPRKVGEL